MHTFISYERHQELVGLCATHPDARVRSIGTSVDGRSLDLISMGMHMHVCVCIHIHSQYMIL
jgi:hypothetical protein